MKSAWCKNLRSQNFYCHHVTVAMNGQNEKPLTEEPAMKSISSYDQKHVDTEKTDVWEDPQAREAHEVFQATSEGVNFRTVSWQRATVLFLKIQFAMSILAVPSSLGALGAVGGALSLVGWQVLNTCMCMSRNRIRRRLCATGFLQSFVLTRSSSDTAIILGEFHNRHPECHSK